MHLNYFVTKLSLMEFCHQPCCKNTIVCFMLPVNLQQQWTFLSAYNQGTPMMLMGDEYGHTRYGNNNSYGHDTSVNHFQWGQVIFYLAFFFLITPIKMTNFLDYLVRQLDARKSSHFRFFSDVIKFRQTHHLFHRENFLDKVISFWLSLLVLASQYCKKIFKFLLFMRLMKHLFYAGWCDMAWRQLGQLWQ